MSMGDPTDAPGTASSRLVGLSAGAGAALIWGAWPVVTKFGVRETLDCFDIAALRFLIAGALLLPVVIRRGLAGEGIYRILLIAFGAGVPYSLFSMGGLMFAPATHAGILGPGMSAMGGILGAWLVLREPFTPARAIGVAFVLLGMIGLGLASVRTGDPVLSRVGDLMFLAAGCLWATYTINVRRTKLTALHATSLVAVVSAFAYLPVYISIRGVSLFSAPPTELLLQSIFQGALAAIAGVFLHTIAVARLGAGGASFFPALVPVVAMALAAIFLGEKPSVFTAAGAIAVTLGMLIAFKSPGLIRGWLRQQRTGDGDQQVSDVQERSTSSPMSAPRRARSLS